MPLQLFANLLFQFSTKLWVNTFCLKALKTLHRSSLWLRYSVSISFVTPLSFDPNANATRFCVFACLCICRIILNLLQFIQQTHKLMKTENILCSILLVRILLFSVGLECGPLHCSQNAQNRVT